MAAPLPISIRAYRPSDDVDVIALWRVCDLVRPWNDPAKDITRKLKVDPDGFLVAELEGRVVASMMIGYDGHRGWINYLAVDPAVQRSGIGRALLTEAELRLRAVGCPKINLQVRRTNSGVVAYYERLGFAADDVVNLGKRLAVD